MIRQIFSDMDSFKSLEFKPGLNLLLSERSEKSSERQTRNGVGKSSLVELIHFLFGSESRRDSIFQADAIKPWTFNAKIELGGKDVVVSRCGLTSNKVSIAGNPDWPNIPESEPVEGLIEYNNEEWKAVLGNLLFGLPAVELEANVSGYPSFRSLFPYFARRQIVGGFQNPIEFFAKQPAQNSQLAISYLIGLDWKISNRLHELRSEEKELLQVQKVVKSEIFGQFFGSAVEITKRIKLAEENAREISENLRNFKVVREYRNFEEEANELTTEINSLNGENVFDSSLLKELKDSLVEEEPPNFDSLFNTFNEAGVVFPELVRHRFDEVKTYHTAIIENRKVHLTDEILSIEQRITKRVAKIEVLDKRRQQLMSILTEGLALEHYTKLQEEAGRLESEIEALKLRSKQMKEVDNNKTELKIKRESTLKEMRDDFQEREEYLGEAYVVFESLSKSLYEKAGSLRILPSDMGPKFDIQIDSQRSKGISNMQIFCFDMMLMILNHKRNKNLNFLIHDSHLFDGVDERQIAKALEIGSEHAEKLGFQYIVTMNTDLVPYECFSSGFEINDYVLETKLTDKTDTGGLFGIQF